MTDFRCLFVARVMCDVEMLSSFVCSTSPWKLGTNPIARQTPFKHQADYSDTLVVQPSLHFNPFHILEDPLPEDGEFSSWNPSIFPAILQSCHQPRPENIQMLPRIHIFQGTALSEQDLSGDSGSVSGASYPVVQMINDDNR